MKIALGDLCSDAIRNNQLLGQGGQGLSAVFSPTPHRNDKRNAEGARGDQRNRTTQQSTREGLQAHQTSQYMYPSGAGMEGVGKADEEENKEENGKNEMSAA